jgi:hypothetical protein
MKLIEPLTNPTEYGGKAEDAFDVVIPSLPGHGLSGKPSITGWGPERIANAWAVLIDRLGYKKYVARHSQQYARRRSARKLLFHFFGDLIDQQPALFQYGVIPFQNIQDKGVIRQVVA